MTSKPHRTYYLQTRRLLLQGLGATVATLAVSLVALDASSGMTVRKQINGAFLLLARDPAAKAIIATGQIPDPVTAYGARGDAPLGRLKITNLS